MTEPTDARALFIKAYKDNLHTAFQQTERKLARLVTEGGHFVGDTVYFPRLGVVEATDLVRLQEITQSMPDHSMIPVSCAPSAAAIPISDIDRNKLTISLGVYYAKETVKAIYRKQDKVIYEAMLAAANAAGSTIRTIGSYTAPLRIEHIAQAVALLGDTEAFVPGETAVVMPFSTRMNFALDLSAAAAATDNREVIKGLGKFLDPLAGVEAETFEGCSNVTAGQTGGNIGTDVFVFAKAAVVSAYNDDVVEINERLGSKLTDLRGAWTQTGAAVRDEVGLIRIRCKRNVTVEMRGQLTRTS